MNFIKSLKNTLCLTLLLSLGQAAAAQTVTISPLPQEINWGTSKAFDCNVAFKVKGAKTADADALALLKSRFKDCLLGCLMESELGSGSVLCTIKF